MTVLIGEGPVLLELDHGIARLKLNRPEASNAVDVPTLKALHEAFLRCHAEPGVRVVVMSGEGPNFCTGGDVKTFASKGEDLPEYLREATAWLQIATAAMIQLKAPVVVSVHGFSAGGAGFGFVCAADLVVAARSARFFSGAVRVGMAPDAGTSVTLSRIVGFRRAMDILLTNPTLSADEALDLGLVSRVVEDAELVNATDELARQLASLPAQALAATKRLVWGGLGSSVEDRFAEEARVVSELSGTPDAREGLAAVIERRTPRFEGT